MKKIFCVIVSLIFMFSAIGCENSTSEAPEDSVVDVAGVEVENEIEIEPAKSIDLEDYYGKTLEQLMQEDNEIVMDKQDNFCQYAHKGDSLKFCFRIDQPVLYIECHDSKYSACDVRVGDSGDSMIATMKAKSQLYKRNEGDDRFFFVKVETPVEYEFKHVDGNYYRIFFGLDLSGNVKAFTCYFDEQ